MLVQKLKSSFWYIFWRKCNKFTVRKPFKDQVARRNKNEYHWQSVFCTALPDFEHSALSEEIRWSKKKTNDKHIKKKNLHFSQNNIFWDDKHKNQSDINRAKWTHFYKKNFCWFMILTFCKIYSRVKVILSIIW